MGSFAIVYFFNVLVCAVYVYALLIYNVIQFVFNGVIKVELGKGQWNNV